MRNRLSKGVLSLLGLLGVLYAVAVLFALYLAATAGQGKWERVEPWFGAEPEVVRSRDQTDFGSAWLVKADETWVSELVRRTQSEPTKERRTDDEVIGEYRGRRRILATYQPEKPLLLLNTDGSPDIGPRKLSIEVLSDGYAIIDWRPYYSRDREGGYLPIRADFDRDTRKELALALIAIPFLAFGPTLIIDAALLLLLPPGPRRRKLWYLLPLGHGGVLLLVALCSALSDGESLGLIAAPFIALFWCLFSLLQSLFFGGAVRLAAYVCHAEKKI